MDYKKIYDSLMLSRLALKNTRKLEKIQGKYFERHHIIPKSMGGNKSYSISSENIVLLTAKEHYMAHYLLWSHFRNRSMALAFHKMTYSNNLLQKRKFTAKQYEAAKIAFSESQRGSNNPMFGKPGPNKGKISRFRGIKTGPRLDMLGDNNPAKSKEAREKISKALKGKKKKPMSEETRTNISKRTKGELNPRFGKYKSHFTDIKIYEYNLQTGDFIQEWNNIIEISEFKNIDRKCIFSVTKTNYGCRGSFYFTQYKGEKINPFDFVKKIKGIITT